MTQVGRTNQIPIGHRYCHSITLPHRAAVVWVDRGLIAVWAGNLHAQGRWAVERLPTTFEARHGSFQIHAQCLDNHVGQRMPGIDQFHEQKNRAAGNFRRTRYLVFNGLEEHAPT